MIMTVESQVFDYTVPLDKMTFISGAWSIVDNRVSKQTEVAY